MKLKKAFFLTAFLFLFILVSTALYIWYFKAPFYISGEVSKFLKRKVTVEQISFLKNDTIQLRNITIYEKDEKRPFLKVEKVTASLDIRGLLAGKIYLSGLFVDNLRCFIVQNNDNQFNFIDILQTLSRPSEKKISWRITPVSLNGEVIFQIKELPALNLKIISKAEVGTALEKQKVSISLKGDDFSELKGDADIKNGENKSFNFSLAGKNISLKILKHFGFNPQTLKIGAPELDININGSKKDDKWFVILAGSAGSFEIMNMTPVTLKYRIDGIYSEKEKKVIFNDGLINSSSLGLIKFKGFIDNFKSLNINLTGISKKIMIKDVALSDVTIEGKFSGTIPSFESSGSFQIKEISLKEYMFEDIESKFNIEKNRGTMTLKLDGTINSGRGDNLNGFILSLSKKRGELKGNLKFEAPYKNETVTCKISDFYLHEDKKIVKAGLVELQKGKISGDLENVELSFNDKRISFSSGKGKFQENKETIPFSTLNGKIISKGGNHDFSASSVIAGGDFIINGTVYGSKEIGIDLNFKNIPLKEIEKKIGKKSNIGFSKGKMDGNASILINNNELSRLNGKINIGKTNLHFKGEKAPFASNITGSTLFVYENGLISGSVNFNIPDFTSFKADASYNPRNNKGEIYLRKENLEIDKLIKFSTPFIPPLLKDASGRGAVDIDLKAAYLSENLEADGNVTLKEVDLDFLESNIKAEGINAVIPLHYNSKKMSGLAKKDGWLKFKTLESGPVIINNFSSKIDGEGDSIGINNIQFQIFKGAGAGKIKITLPAKKEKISFLSILNFSDLSLKDATSRIKGMKGEITGRVDGLLVLSGQEFDLNNLTGRIDFVSKESKDEKMKISKEFLKQLGGEKVAFFMLGDSRDYDKGVLNGIINKGYIVFEELELSHTNIFGMQDLSVKVAPYHNKIALDHFIWATFEASKRAAGAGDRTNEE